MVSEEMTEYSVKIGEFDIWTYPTFTLTVSNLIFCLKCRIGICKQVPTVIFIFCIDIKQMSTIFLCFPTKKMQKF